MVAAAVMLMAVVVVTGFSGGRSCGGDGGSGDSRDGCGGCGDDCGSGGCGQKKNIAMRTPETNNGGHCTPPKKSKRNYVQNFVKRCCCTSSFHLDPPERDAHSVLCSFFLATIGPTLSPHCFRPP